MANNLGYTEGSGKIVSSKERSDSSHTQVVYVDLSAAAGAPTPLTAGQALAAASIPVVLPSDGTLPLPSGAATSAKQDTIIGHVDGIEGLLTTIDADTGNVATSTASIDTKTPALGQALAAASVPVVLPAAQIATLTPPAAITGFATSAKQDTEIASLASIDGKITTCNTGSIAGTVTANAGANLNTSALALEAGGNLASIKAKTDNIPAQGQALAAASLPVVLTAAQVTTLTPPAAITGFATETTLSALNTKVTAVNTGAVTISTALPAGSAAIGKLAANDGVDIGDVTINNASGASAVNIQDGGNSITVDGTVAVSNSTFPVTDNSGSLTVDAPVATPVFVRLSDGTSAIATLPVSLASVPSHAVTVASGGIASGAVASGAIASGAVASGAFASGSIASGAIVDGAMVTIGAKTDAKSTSTDTTSVSAMSVLKQISASVQAPPSQAVTNAGTFAVQAVSAGAAAHGAAVSGNPVLAGLEARDTLGTAVTSGQAVRAAGNRYGSTYISAFPPSHASSNGTPITATTTSVIAAPAASSHLRIVRIHISNGGSTATWVAVRDGASGTRHYNTYLPQGGFLSLNLNDSGPLDLTTATRLDIVLSAAGSVEYEIDYLTVAD